MHDPCRSGAPLHAVATDQPGGLVLRRPMQKLRQIIVMYTLLPLLCGGIGAYVATQVAYARSAAHTDQRIAVLESDLAQRRKANAEANAARDAQIAQLRAVLCVTLDHLQPRDAQVEELRAEYLCTGGPYVIPPTGPAPGEGATPQAPRATPSTRRPATPPRIQPTRAAPTGVVPQPQPQPTPPAVDPPPGGNLIGCTDLPLLPKLCL